MNQKYRLFVALGLLSTLTAVLSAASTKHAISSPAIPQGTHVQVRIIDHLSSETARPGDTFQGTLEVPIVVNGRVLYPKGSDVNGQVTAAHRSGRLSDPGVLELVLTSVSNGRTSSPLSTQPFLVKGESHTKSNLEKIGGSAAAGAIIGALAGGGKGAAIGTGVGAAAGTGVAAATGRREAKVESEAVLTWVTAGNSVGAGTGSPSSPLSRNTLRSSDGDRDRAYDDDRDDQGEDNDASQGFSARDRHMIRGCFSENYSNLPPGLAKRDSLPPGLERQLRRNGTLPPGLEKRVQPLPDVCEVRLPRLPRSWQRVVLGGRVLLLDSANRILDLFTLEEDE